MASRVGTVALFVAKTVLRVLWMSTMVLTPLFGFWLASSLAAYHNASQWLSLLVGLLLFPILPVAWEAFYAWRRTRKGTSDRAILTGLDRLVLRTLVINGLFLGGMMWQAKADALRAITVRGDWMFDGHDGPVASTFRGWLLTLADHLDRDKPTADTPYGKSDQAPTTITPTPTPTPTPTEDTQPSRRPDEWPLPVDVDPIVANMPDDAQTSIETVGAYLAAHITDKRQLTKAVHDYVVHRLHYDFDALAKIQSHDYEHTPPQTAEAAFAGRTAVCEGYARLMVALGKSAGLEIAFVTGYIRDSNRRLQISDDPWDTSRNEALEGVSHAWNAVKLDGTWYLIDATWDDPTNGEPTTTYLFVPPQYMVFDHLPEEANWQLLANPLSLGEFVRQPMLSPAIGELGITLTSPTRSQITVDGEATITLDNPYGAEIMADAHRDGSKHDDDGTPCRVQPGKSTTITCALGSGEFEIQMFAAPASHATAGSYKLDYIGSILVNSH